MGLGGYTPGVMLAALTVVVILFFLGMGVVALTTPERISATFGQATLTPAGRNEVRAVYGGFGVAIAALLAWATTVPALRLGIFLAVAVALAGMAFGRLVAAAIERSPGFYPAWFYCGLELVMAAILYAARAG